MWKRVTFWVILLQLTSAAPLLQAQDNLAQLRVPVHVTKDLSEKWFLTSWVIGNVKQAQPNNLNFFGGVGYRGEKWWLEGLLQRQWNGNKSQWQLNFRFNEQIGKRISLYAELYPLSSRHTFSETAILDYRLARKWKVGVETENVHQKSRRDSYGGGPRLSYQILARDKVTTWLTGTYHFRSSGEPNFFRVYLLTNIRF